MSSVLQHAEQSMNTGLLHLIDASGGLILLLSKLELLESKFGIEARLSGATSKHVSGSNFCGCLLAHAAVIWCAVQVEDGEQGRKA